MGKPGTRFHDIKQGELGQILTRRDSFALFVYTPLCGTCKLAAKMLQAAAAVSPPVTLYTVNLNLMPALAQDWKIESVPCLMIFRQGELVSRVYAMRSVEHLSQQLRLLTDLEQSNRTGGKRDE
ncbi:MAG: thioredoxin family protein [Brevibacillus sp.]|nr:thioredoxin family protein [Brevibacillus sp.]